MLIFFTFLVYHFKGRFNQTAKYYMLPSFGFGKDGFGSFKFECDIDINCQFMSIILFKFPNYPSITDNDESNFVKNKTNMLLQFIYSTTSNKKTNDNNDNNNNKNNNNNSNNGNDSDSNDLIESGTWFPVIVNTAPRYVCYNLSLILTNEKQGIDHRDKSRFLTIPIYLSINSLMFLGVVIYNRKWKTTILYVLCFALYFSSYLVYYFQMKNIEKETDMRFINQYKFNTPFLSIVFNGLRCASLFLSAFLGTILAISQIFYDYDLKLSNFNFILLFILLLLELNDFLMENVYLFVFVQQFDFNNIFSKNFKNIFNNLFYYLFNDNNDDNIDNSSLRINNKNKDKNVLKHLNNLNSNNNEANNYFNDANNIYNEKNGMNNDNYGIYVHQLFFVFVIIYLFYFIWKVKQTLREAFMIEKIFFSKMNKDMYKELRNRIVRVIICALLVIVAVVGSSFATYLSLMRGGETIASFVTYDVLCFLMLFVDSAFIISIEVHKNKCVIADLLYDRQVNIFTISTKEFISENKR